MKTIIRAILAAFVLALPLPALAMWDNWPEVSDGMVKTIAQSVRDRMDEFLKADHNMALPPETDAEKQKPVIPFEDQRRAVRRGMINAYADWCGYDWKQKSAVPFLMEENKKNIWSQRQMAYIKYVMAATQSGLEHNIKKGDCPPATKRVVENYIYK